MKILSIVGARPQFVKVAALSRVIQNTYSEVIENVLVHTGQHFDENMSSIFFNELGIPSPKYNLEIANLSHGAMTGRMIEAVEKVVLIEKPDWIVIFGDTNSTLAAALAVSKLKIPLAHVEAGLRSFNMAMPEEINRVIADRVSNLLFCPSHAALSNLENEGYPFVMANSKTQKIELVGDVMFDVTLYYREFALSKLSLDKWGVTAGDYVLCTIHRAENTDDFDKLRNILEQLQLISKYYRVVIPLHPRTMKLIQTNNLLNFLDGLQVLHPLSYLEMQRLEIDAKIILTDSGGVQKEAYFHSVPCVTLRTETEWVETVSSGWNCLVDTRLPGNILDSISTHLSRTRVEILDYGNGKAADKIISSIVAY